MVYYLECQLQKTLKVRVMDHSKINLHYTKQCHYHTSGLQEPQSQEMKCQICFVDMKTIWMTDEDDNDDNGDYDDNNDEEDDDE